MIKQFSSINEKVVFLKLQLKNLLNIGRVLYLTENC